MSLIKFNNFSYRYKGNEIYALNSINLKIEQNKFILLVGETGSGKTTFIRCMNGLVPQFYPGHYKGTVEVVGKDASETPITELSTEVGIVFQNPENQLISMNVEHEIAFGLENLAVPREVMDRRIKECAKITGIEHLMQKAPFELSGGEQQRVAIASILALEPKILVLDEPTALLDPLMARNILYLLKEIQMKKKITIVISEHRLDLTLPLSDEIIVMKDGRILEHDIKERVINGIQFQKTNINYPFIYSIFVQLKSENIYNGLIPCSIEEGVQILKDLKNK